MGTDQGHTTLQASQAAANADPAVPGLGQVLAEVRDELRLLRASRTGT